MNPRLLRAYEDELRYLRLQGAEFAAEYPSRAKQLGLDKPDAVDPYVERLIEGVAFLTARVQVKLDAEFPRFTQRLIETIYPNLLAPIPSMLVARFEPELTDASLAEGPELPRGTLMSAATSVVGAARCRYTLAQPVRLWPVEVVAATARVNLGELPVPRRGLPPGVSGALRLRLRSTAELAFSAISMDDLRIHLAGIDSIPFQIYESIYRSCVGMVVYAPGAPGGETAFLGPECVAPVGFADDEAMLPTPARSFSGLRLVQEYFALPSRFLFFDLLGLGPSIRRCAKREIDIVILLDRDPGQLAGRIGPENFLLHCAPAVNLFQHRTEPIDVDERASAFQVLPDRIRPFDYEIHSVSHARGYGHNGEEWDFRPLYAPGREDVDTGQGYFGIVREPAILPEPTRIKEDRSAYVGNETFVSIVDPDEAPWPFRLRQISVRAQCTNRDLPTKIRRGQGRTDLELDAAAPLRSVRIVAGPSPPGSASRVSLQRSGDSDDGGDDGDGTVRSNLQETGALWRLIDQLPTNYFALLDSDGPRGARALRALLRFHASAGSEDVARHVEGLREVTARPITRRIPGPGPLTFVRGMEASFLLDEEIFRGYGAFVFGKVLSEYFSRYVGINSFVESVFLSTSRNEVMRWKPKVGTRPIL